MKAVGCLTHSESSHFILKVLGSRGGLFSFGFVLFRLTEPCRFVLNSSNQVLKVVLLRGDGVVNYLEVIISSFLSKQNYIKIILIECLKDYTIQKSTLYHVCLL